MPDISIAEAALMLTVSQDTVRRAVDRGDLDSYRTPGGHRRVSLVDVQRMIDER